MTDRKLDDWIASYLDYTDNSEPPLMYREWIAISVIAAVLQRKCYLNWGPITFYPNMYIVLVGPSGKCRKGTAMSIGAKFLYDHGVKMAAEAITREALIRELNQVSSSEVDPRSGEFIMHASLTIYSQELTVFLGYNNQQLISDLTDWYDCRDRWTYRTKGQGTDEIIGVYVNLIGATTPDLIQSALPRDAIGGGLASRIIFVYEEEKGKSVPFPFLSKEMTDLKDKLLMDLERIGMMSGEFVVTSDFLDLYGEWYHMQEENPPFEDPNFEGYFQRRPNHVLKLSIILSAATRDDQVIDAEILARAIDLLERTERKMPRTFSGYGSSRTADVFSRIMTYIRVKRETTKAEILQMFYGDVENERHLDSMLETLKAMGWIGMKFNLDTNETTINYLSDNPLKRQFE